MEASVALEFTLVSPGSWPFSFRTIEAFVASASTLIIILNVFVFEKMCEPKKQGDLTLTTYNYNYKKMANDSLF